MNEFTESVNQKLGPSAIIDELTGEIGEEVETPEFKLYQDQTTKPCVVPDRVISQDFDTYIGAEVMLPIRDQIKTGRSENTKDGLMV